MAKILADRQVRTLIGSVLLDADEGLLSPNGIRLRLGRHVRFLSTDEEKDLKDGLYLRVDPGETVQVASLERLDLTKTTVQGLFPGKMLMGLITPTTTMMREGVLQVATKIDAGFRGYLNWGFRNSGASDLLLGFGEPIFKLTLFLLDEDESPDITYGERNGDKYQDSEGIRRSTRRIPASLSKNKVVGSSREKLDPKKYLSEAGYPFNHISTELVELHGKFEVVSTEVKLLKDGLDKGNRALSEKIEAETKRVTGRLEDFTRHCFERVESIFDRKFLRVIGTIVAAVPAMYALYVVLKGTTLGDSVMAAFAAVAAVVIFLVTYLLSRRRIADPPR